MGHPLGSHQPRGETRSKKSRQCDGFQTLLHPSHDRESWTATVSGCAAEAVAACRREASRAARSPRSVRAEVICSNSEHIELSLIWNDRHVCQIGSLCSHIRIYSHEEVTGIPHSREQLLCVLCCASSSLVDPLLIRLDGLSLRLTSKVISVITLRLLLPTNERVLRARFLTTVAVRSQISSICEFLRFGTSVRKQKLIFNGA
jgi:hypothetical protein